MASIEPGQYKVSELLAAAGFDLAEEAAVDYNDLGYDPRRVRVGGLPVGSADDEVFVPATADEVLIELDGKEASRLDVDVSKEEHQEARRYSFETAADADGPAARVEGQTTEERSETER